MAHQSQGNEVRGYALWPLVEAQQGYPYTALVSRPARLLSPQRPIATCFPLDRSGNDPYMSEEKNPAAVGLGRLGERTRGKAGAQKLTPNRDRR